MEGAISIGVARVVLYIGHSVIPFARRRVRSSRRAFACPAAGQFDL
jgi:hypothetical protein